MFPLLLAILKPNDYDVGYIFRQVLTILIHIDIDRACMFRLV